MDTLTAIHRRRTVHSWTDTPVDDAVLDRILDAAHQAPCHRKTWPWRFIVVGRETREQLVPVGARLAAKKAGVAVSPKVERAVRCKVVNPGALVAVVLEGSDDPFRHRENYAATACAIQNMLLAATALGLGSKWGTGGLTRAPETASILGVDTTTEEVVGFVFVGTPAKVPDVGRPPLEDFVSRLA
mgnify:CR=1 FL=1